MRPVDRRVLESTGLSFYSGRQRGSIDSDISESLKRYLEEGLDEEEFSYLQQDLGIAASMNRFIGIGVIEDFDVEIDHVKPRDFQTGRMIGNRVGLSLAPYKKRSFVLMCKDRYQKPSIILRKVADEHGLGSVRGAANYVSSRNPAAINEAIVYYPAAYEKEDLIRVMDDLDSVVSFAPSENYKELDLRAYLGQRMPTEI